MTTTPSCYFKRSGTLAGLPWAGSWWAGLVGFGQMSSFPFFSDSFPLSFFCFQL
jgi:hypothetical protein